MIFWPDEIVSSGDGYVLDLTSNGNDSFNYKEAHYIYTAFRETSRMIRASIMRNFGQSRSEYARLSNRRKESCSTHTLLLFQTALTWTMLQFTGPTYGDYVYPAWTSTFGWMLAAASIVPVPIVAAVQLYTATGLTFKQVLTDKPSFISNCCESPSPSYRKVPESRLGARALDNIGDSLS